MNRRDFLIRLAQVSAGLAVSHELDLDRLLWRPKSMIIVPAMPFQKVGMAIRWVQHYDVQTDQFPRRLDAWVSHSLIV